jgi:hypothetical protein
LLNAVNITVDNDSCKAIVTLSNIRECDYFENIEWGDGTIDNGPFDADTMLMHVYTGSGSYNISLLAIEKDSAGFICFEKFIRDTINISCTVGTFELNEQHLIMLFPNPAKDEILLEFEILPGKDWQLHVFDISGKEVKSNMLESGERLQKLSLTEINKGIYFIQISKKGMPIWIKKLIKL